MLAIFIVPNTKYRMLVSELFNLIGEGIHDRHTYKAVFMAGSPGSGKTTVRKSLFGGTSLKVVDPDEMDDIELSDEVIVRLWVARMKAVQRHRELYA